MCGVLLSPSNLAHKRTGHFSVDTNDSITFVTNDCTPFTESDSFVIASLPVGTYQISKVLTVNQEAIQAYMDLYLDTTINNCRDSYNDFLSEAAANSDTGVYSIGKRR
jgi:hypothetical protein